MGVLTFILRLGAVAISNSPSHPFPALPSQTPALSRDLFSPAQPPLRTLHLLPRAREHQSLQPHCPPLVRPQRRPSHRLAAYLLLWVPLSPNQTFCHSRRVPAARPSPTQSCPSGPREQTLVYPYPTWRSRRPPAEFVHYPATGTSWVVLSNVVPAQGRVMLPSPNHPRHPPANGRSA